MYEAETDEGVDGGEDVGTVFPEAITFDELNAELLLPLDNEMGPATRRPAFVDPS